MGDIIREAVERVIANRENKPALKPAELRANLRSFLNRHANTGPDRSLEEIERLVDGP